MTTHSCDVAVQAEFLVVSNFVKHSEFLDILVGDARSTCVGLTFGRVTFYVAHLSAADCRLVSVHLDPVRVYAYHDSQLRPLFTTIVLSRRELP